MSSFSNFHIKICAFGFFSSYPCDSPFLVYTVYIAFSGNISFISRLYIGSIPVFFTLISYLIFWPSFAYAPFGIVAFWVISICGPLPVVKHIISDVASSFILPVSLLFSKYTVAVSYIYALCSRFAGIFRLYFIFIKFACLTVSVIFIIYDFTFSKLWNSSVHLFSSFVKSAVACSFSE